jgi:IclR family transcriptional regulator, pca regulon regulatory protein
VLKLADPDPRNRRYSQSLERGLAVLGCFTPERPLLGITDIADELGMNKSTTYRYATTLVALGYLEQSTSSPKYRLGLRVIDLGMTALNSLGLREQAHAELQELRLRAGYTVNLAVLEGAEIRYVDRALSLRGEQAESDLDLHPGSKLPAYCTSLGKLLLAYLPEEEQHRRIAEIGTLSKRAANTITSKQALSRELAQVRAKGLAVNNEELAAQIVAFARPVRNEAGDVVAGIGLAAHSSAITLQQLVDALDHQLIATADRISARLGFRREDERRAG